MSFSEVFHALPIHRWVGESMSTQPVQVQEALASPATGLDIFKRLISPAAAGHLEALCHRSQQITRRRFGKVVRLFAPLYLSNECINNCQYCGFSRDNPILRVTLSLEEVVREARALKTQGFRSILLVSGEHPRFVTDGYMRDCVRAVAAEVPGVSLEVGPMETPEYVPMVQAGAEGLVVYQETYDREIYAEMHTAGPKRDFDWRLETPERAYSAGFKRLGIGALYGLSDWRREALSLAAHAAHLLKHCWKAQITLSMPRLRPCAGQFQPRTTLADRELVQLVAAFRIAFPDVGLVLSTREPSRLRDGLIPLGITLISAGSHTEPGGYTGAGREKIHRTERGRIVELSADASEWAVAGPGTTAATGQFEIADNRPADVVARRLEQLGLEPVWKDWEGVLSGSQA